MSCLLRAQFAAIVYGTVAPLLDAGEIHYYVYTYHSSVRLACVGCVHCLLSHATIPTDHTHANVTTTHWVPLSPTTSFLHDWVFSSGRQTNKRTGTTHTVLSMPPLSYTQTGARYTEKNTHFSFTLMTIPWLLLYMYMYIATMYGSMKTAVLSIVALKVVGFACVIGDMNSRVYVV